MQGRCLSENAANLTQPSDTSYKQTCRPGPGVCQINSVNLNLTVRIISTDFSKILGLTCMLICRYIERNHSIE